MEKTTVQPKQKDDKSLVDQQKPTKAKKQFESPQLKELGNLGEKYQALEGMELDPKVLDFLSKTYPKELAFLSDVPFTPNLIEKLLSHFRLNTIDPGLLRTSEFELTYPKTVEGKTVTESEVIKAEGVPVMNRAAFVNKTIENLMDKNGEYDGKNLAILVGDIANLRQADLVKDNHGNSYADVLLNQVAGTIDSITEEFKKKFGEDEDVCVSFGRYGGDEFVVSVTGNADQEKLDMLAGMIRNKLFNLTGRYLDGDGQVVESATNLKNNAIEQINMPESVLKQRVFLHYLQKGLIFNEEELEKSLSKFTDNEGVLNEGEVEEFLEKEEKEHSIYPDNVFEGDKNPIVAKGRYLASKNAELGLMVLAANKYDQDNLKKGIITDTAGGVLRMVENIIFDPLLRESVLTFTEIFDDLSNQKASELHLFDLKFIKEINDNAGLVEGDLAIKHFWLQLQTKIEKEDEKKVIFGRRGGTMFLEVKKGEKLSEKTIENLNQFTHATILEDSDNDYKGTLVPIGKSTIKFDDNKEYSRDEIGQMLDGLFDESEEEFLKGIMKRLPVINPDTAENSKQLDLDKLATKYLRGKRHDERVEKLINVIKKHAADETERLLLVAMLADRFSKKVK